MSVWTCGLCNHSYIPEQGDPKRGVPMGTEWSELPQDWTCPDCGAPKFDFTETESSGRAGSGWAAD